MRRAPRSNRILATVLFTDVVGSTERAVELGDRGWRDLLGRHNALIRRQLRRFGGREVDTAGDGFFATFQQPAEAVRCAAAVADAVRSLGIEIRAGVHMGEVEVIGDKLGGIAVHTGARILSEAGPSEVLVSSTVRDLVAGSELGFDDRGIRQLKGVPGEWRLFALRQPEPIDAAGADAFPAGVPDLGDERERRPISPVARLALALGAVAAVAGIAVGVFLIGSGAGGAGPVIGPNMVVAIDPASNRPIDGVRVGIEPSEVAFGERAVWVANFGDRTVSRVDPVSREEVGTQGGIGVPGAIAAGEGDVWVADSLGNQVYVIDPRTNTHDRNVEVRGARAIAVGFGSVWVADDTSDRVVRLDPSTLQPTEIQLEVGGAPSALAVGEGAIWVANALDSSVDRIDPADNAPAGAGAIALCCRPTAIAAGGGSVWVTSSEQDTVQRIDASTNTAAETIDVADGPAGIAVGFDSVWVANRRSASLWRLDFDGEVVARIDLHGQPVGVAIGDELVWVTVQAP